VTSAATRIVIFEKERMKYAGVLIIGLLALDPGFGAAAQGPAAPPAKGRSGQVQIQGRAVRDAAGPFNALGATFFWGAWAYKVDRARLERNLEALSAAGVDYIRVLGSVGGTSWEDRQTDPRWQDYDAIIAGLTDLAYDRYGLRVQWTIFGGAPFTPAGTEREKLVDRFATMAQGREHKIFAFEIANEGWQNGFEGAEGIDELRRLGKRLSDRTPVLVALTAPQSSGACALYGGAAADVMTVHYSRAFDDEGPTKPLRRPWSFPSAYDEACRGALPSAVLNNEPIGPESSVEADDSPARIGAAFVMTFLAGNASYVFHSGPGIRGGGTADISGSLRRHAHFDELPSFKPIAAALRSAKRYLPRNLPNWTRHAPNAASAPLHGFDRLYMATSDQRFVGLAIGVSKSITLSARAPMTFHVRQASTGRILKRVTVKSGQNITVSADEALVLVGRLM
jgi:hypothetical protein